jgi:hypothetical protein
MQHPSTKREAKAVSLGTSDKKQHHIATAVSQGSSDKKQHHKSLLGINSLLLYFTMTLGIGLLFHSLYRFIQTHHLPLHHRSPSSPIKLVKDDWESVSYHGDISIQRHPMEKTQLYQYRYWLETTIPKDAILNILVDPNKTHEWMPWLVEKEERQDILTPWVDVDSQSKQTEDSSTTLRKGFDHKVQVLSKFRFVMPYPGLHMRQVVAYHSVEETNPTEPDGQEPTSKIVVKSLSEDDPNLDKYPLCDACKRAYMDLEIHLIPSWIDSSQGNVVQFMNPRVSKLPLFMVNAMNQKWGIAALHRLVRLGHQSLGLDELSPAFSWKDLKRSFQAALIPVEG